MSTDTEVTARINLDNRAMNAIILAAGYGTRLEKELTENGKDFNHLLNVPKALLPIGGVPLITRMVEKLKNINCIKNVIVATNKLHHDRFVEWRQSFDDYVQLVCDDSTCNEDRLGSNGSIQYVLDKTCITEDILVIAGDTLFYEDFDISKFLDQFYHRKIGNDNCVLVTSYPCEDHEVSKHGILELDEKHHVERLIEKPKPSETTSRQACPCFYAISSSALHLVSDFLKENKNLPLKSKDATGHLIKYFITRSNVFAYSISGRFDVGGLESYIICDKHFTQL